MPQLDKFTACFIIAMVTIKILGPLFLIKVAFARLVAPFCRQLGLSPTLIQVPVLISCLFSEPFLIKGMGSSGSGWLASWADLPGPSNPCGLEETVTGQNTKLTPPPSLSSPDSSWIEEAYGEISSTPITAGPLPQPEALATPAPALIPLISDEDRRKLLYDLFSALNFGGDPTQDRMDKIINAQLFVERSVETALREDGFSAESILAQYGNIRSILHSSTDGRLWALGTYQSYVAQILECGTRESTPYRRIRRALLNYDLFLNL